MSRNFIFKKRVFTFLLISYIIIFLVPTFTLCYSHIHYSKLLKNEIDHTNTSTLVQLRNVMDEYFYAAERFSQQIESNRNILSLANSVKPLKDFHQSILYSAVHDLKLLTITNNSIGDFYIYFKGLGSVLNNDHIDAQLFYERISSYDEFDYAQWIAFLNKFHRGDYLPFTLCRNSVNRHRQITYVRSLPIVTQEESKATVVVHIDMDSLQKTIKNVENATSGKIVILNSENEVIFPYENQDFINLAREGVANNRRFMKSESDGKDYVVSCVNSQNSSFSYALVVPKSVYMERIQHIQTISIYGILFVLLFGVVAIYILLKKNYQPLNSVMETITEFTGITFEKNENEYEFIKETILNSFSQIDKTKMQLSQHNKELRANFLRRLLKGISETNISTEDMLFTFDISFESEYFAVMLFQIKDYFSSFEDTDTDIGNNKELQLSQYILTNAVEAIASGNNPGFMVELDEETMACLINIHEENLSRAKTDMIEMAVRAKQFAEEKFNLTFVTAISNVHLRLDGIPDAYQEALQAMEYNMIIGNRDVTCYDDISSLSQKPHYDYTYTLDTELRLINFIKAGDFDSALAVWKQIYEENISRLNNQASIHIVKCLISDIISTVVKTINELSDVFEADFFENTNVIDDFLHCKTLADLDYQITNILGIICEKINSKKENKQSHKLVDYINSYIEENYNDIDLNLSTLSQKLNLTPTYVSLIYKENMGDSLINTINKLRIEAAKKLLKETNENIGNIATKVGFNSSHVFIRVFKKHEGVTPGQYKELK